MMSELLRVHEAKVRHENPELTDRRVIKHLAQKSLQRELKTLAAAKSTSSKTGLAVSIAVEHEREERLQRFSRIAKQKY